MVTVNKTRFFATAKTHKFENFDDITASNLKLRPISNGNLLLRCGESQTF